ncbi:hypothetical protein CICLE_v10018151mg, partial [Citrus x clementina]
TNPVDTRLLKCNPGLHPQIWVYDVYQPDEIRKAYLMVEKHPRRFQSTWFDSFPSWLEYSPTKDAAFCLPCYLFNTPFAQSKYTTYIVDGFNGNFLQLLKAFASNNEKIAKVILEKAPKYASYTSPDIQKEILHVFPIKRNDELKRAQAANIEYMISIDELESERELDQIGTLQRPVNTRWSSHFRSVSNLIKMFSATCSILLNMIEDGTNVFQRGDIDVVYEVMTTFKFVFILHLLFILSLALDPRECRKSFRIGDVCQLADEFYPADFTNVDKMNLKIQLEHYEYSIVQHLEFKSLLTISDLSQWLVSTRKATIFPLVYIIILLVLTLPVSTATTERSFLVMCIVKTRLHNKIEDEFLTNSLIMYIEREIEKN